jgi:hypothetical protein
LRAAPALLIHFTVVVQHRTPAASFWRLRLEPVDCGDLAAGDADCMDGAISPGFTVRDTTVLDTRLAKSGMGKVGSEEDGTHKTERRHD